MINDKIMSIYSKLSEYANLYFNKLKLNKTNSNLLRDVDLTRSTTALS